MPQVVHILKWTHAVPDSRHDPHPFGVSGITHPGFCMRWVQPPLTASARSGDSARGMALGAPREGRLLGVELGHHRREDFVVDPTPDRCAGASDRSALIICTRIRR